MTYIPSKSTLKLYGLSADEWMALFSFQGGRCPICHRLLRGGEQEGKRAAVDHDHRTGRIRALLCCYPCNYVLGYLHDKADMFQECANYLRNPPAPHVLNKIVPKKKRRTKKK